MMGWAPTIMSCTGSITTWISLRNHSSIEFTIETTRLMSVFHFCHIISACVDQFRVDAETGYALLCPAPYLQENL